VNAPSNTSERVNDRVQNAPEPVHLVALSGCHTLADKIRYACEHNRPNPTTATVRDWLTRYHVDTRRSYASTVVNAWRKENGLSDTGDLPALSAELLAELDAVNGVSERVQDASSAGSERVRDASTGRPAPAGAKGFYLVAAMSMLVSIDTSWRFFGHNLHITATWERAVMFAVIEVALIACAYGMRANVQRTGRPGAPRLFAWILCGMAGYMAWQLSGVAEGIARVALGPTLGLVMLHLALGIEIRAGLYQVTTWTRIGRELRERFLSRFGLANDERDALARTRDRAARRVARLSLGKVVLFRAVRVARAVRASGVAHDPAGRARMLTELAAIRHAGELATLEQPSPWTS
jgi:hypothetical protein